ncbi:uncharacterized protein LOC130786582 isoform X4 [Actinidia eriantha]|uniref:uncharacterized protein LOC130786582 isoform X4 n=1 Tax=Actinidia eriantha TaxID=165200 RepID=UPI0025895987|nr:uncharacterized protein LOC130786582 isoform X4 [Actinidia eriantha]
MPIRVGGIESPSTRTSVPNNFVNRLLCIHGTWGHLYQSPEGVCCIYFLRGSSLKLVAQCLGSLGSMNLSFSRIKTVKTQFSASRRALTVQAGYSDGRTPGSADIFIGGFVLGGIVVGALGCAYARTSENA